MVFERDVCPPPVVICPQTAAKLDSQRFIPLGPFTLLEVAKERWWSHLLHLLFSIEANPARFSPMRVTSPPQSAECLVIILIYSPRLFMLMIRDP